ncbi:hypothetical protein B0H14DRAFT_2629654 [Mycena olivaceomarginata]|nr:hypothetical protein B0H14DRAFT_2629654 [Mycena olivaceomarginata]
MYIDSLFSFTQKLCTYAWEFNLNTNPSWFCAAHGLTLGSKATLVISDFGFPKAVHLHWESPLICAGQHAAELMRGIRKRLRAFVNENQKVGALAVEPSQDVACRPHRLWPKVAHHIPLHTALRISQPHPDPVPQPSADRFYPTAEHFNQLFFGNRVRILSGNWGILILSIVSSLFSLIVGLISEVQLWTSTSAVIALELDMRWVKIAAMAATPALDIIIASSLCFYLWRSRDSDLRRKTYKMLDTLILWTIETTLLTSVCAIMQVVLVRILLLAIFASGLIWVSVPCGPGPLNGRKRFHSQDEAPVISDVLAFDFSERRNENTTIDSTLLHSESLIGTSRNHSTACAADATVA